MRLEDLRQNILDAFQAISLLLVFVTMLFTLRYPAIVTDLNEETPSGLRARRKLADKLTRGFWMNAAPIILLDGAALYLLLPLAVEIIRSGTLMPWNADLLLRAYIFVVFWIGAFLVWSSLLGFRLVRKILRVRRVPKSCNETDQPASPQK